MGQQKIKEEAAEKEESVSSNDDDAAFRREQLQRLQDYAAAAESEAVTARKMADDGAIAMEHGTTLPPHSVMEIMRQGPGTGLRTPTVIASGNARVVVSLHQAHRGLRAPGGYYHQFRQRIRELARDFVRDEQPPGRPDPREFVSKPGAAASTSVADPPGHGFSTPSRTDDQSVRSTPPHTIGKRSEGNCSPFSLQ